MEKYVAVFLHDSGMHPPQYEAIEAESQDQAEIKAQELARSADPGRYLSRVAKLDFASDR